MNHFSETSHLSQIIEDSVNKKVIIFKYSNNCGTSERLKAEFEKKMEEKALKNPVYLVTVQELPVLSGKITDWTQIKHETPQILVLEKGKVSYHSADRKNIKLEDFIKF